MTSSERAVLKKIIAEIKDSIIRVNNTLPDYQDNYISASRSGEVSSKESCKDFSHFIEIRFNRECWRIPELKEAMELTRGHLFVCKEIDNEDLYARRFDTALVEMITEDDVESEIDKIISIECDDINLFKYLYPEIITELRDNLNKGIQIAKSVLSKYDNFKFNSVKNRIKLTDRNNKVIK